jgi:hypothetical protein
MREGWLGDDYLILFATSEVNAACVRYSISDFLPGFSVIGLRSWDNLVVTDLAGKTFIVPTVPISPKQLSPFSIPLVEDLQDDERFKDKIKWYVKPLAFGGDPQSEDNITWVDHQSHSELVRWWNRRYRELNG